MLLKKITKNKKAQVQFDIFTVAIVIVSLIILAPVLLKVVTGSIGGFATAINSTSETAGDSVIYVQNKFTSFIDYVIIIFILINIILLFIFAFMVDTHPSFVIFYVISCMFLIWFLPYIGDIGDSIYGHGDVADPDSFISLSNTYLSKTGFFLSNLETIVLGIMIVSGLILYGKWRGSGGGRSGYTGG